MPPAPRFVWWLVLATGLAGLLVGFALGATFSSSRDGGSKTPLPNELGPTARPGVAICDPARAGASGRDENGCWYPENYFEAPPEVVPQVGPGAPVVQVLASGTRPMGIEGTLFFLRAVSPIDEVIVARQWIWPTMEQAVPAGAYQVTIYARSCDANCDFLDPTDFSCSVDLLAEPATTYTIHYDVDDRGNVTCELIT